MRGRGVRKHPSVTAHPSRRGVLRAKGHPTPCSTWEAAGAGGAVVGPPGCASGWWDPSPVSARGPTSVQPPPRSRGARVTQARGHGDRGRRQRGHRHRDSSSVRVGQPPRTGLGASP